MALLHTKCKIFAAIFAIVLFSGCAQQKGWISSGVISDYPQFDSAQLIYAGPVAFNGVQLQFLRVHIPENPACLGIIGFVNVYSLQIPNQEVTICISSGAYVFQGILLEGEQRLLLPEAATQLIIDSLLSGESVNVCLQGFATTFHPENFAKNYRKFSGD